MRRILQAALALWLAAGQPALGAADADALKAAARDLAPGWAHDGAVLGVARLPVADRRRWLEMSRHVLAAMPDEATCAAHTRGALEPSEVLRLELAVLAVVEADPARAAMVAVMQSFDTAEDAAVCRFAQLSLEAALAIEGEAGDLVVRLLTSG